MKYTIKQIKLSKLNKYGFMRYEYAKAHGFSLGDYKTVYKGEIEGEDVNTNLEKLFQKFNIEIPADYKGRSLSVSDVVIIDGNTYYCDSCGWQII